MSHRFIVRICEFDSIDASNRVVTRPNSGADSIFQMKYSIRCERRFISELQYFVGAVLVNNAILADLSANAFYIALQRVSITLKCKQSFKEHAKLPTGDCDYYYSTDTLPTSLLQLEGCYCLNTYVSLIRLY